MSNFTNTSDDMGGDQAVLDALIAGTLIEFKDDRITKLRDYAFYSNKNLININFPNVTIIGNYVFQNCTGLITVSFSELKTMGSYMFDKCSSLIDVSFPKLTTTALNGFNACTNLQNISFPETVTRFETRLFNGCTSLKTVTAPNITYIGMQCFGNCSALEMTSFPNITHVQTNAFENVPIGVISLPDCTFIGSRIGAYNGPLGFDFTKKITLGSISLKDDYNLLHLILRSEELCPLNNIDALANTPIETGYGYIYVPTELVDTYKTAENWSEFASQIIPISEYSKAPEGNITDTWKQIFEAEQDGTYRTKYSIGDIKTVSIDGKYIPMQIVAMDADILTSDTSKTAPITWISVDTIEQRTVSFNQNSNWSNSDIRTYLQNTLFSKIESVVRLNIKEVNKTYYYYNNTNTYGTSSIADTIWMPSLREVFGIAGEDNGPIYSSFFDSNNSRKKYSYNYSVGNIVSWYLRTDGAVVRWVNTNGELAGAGSGAGGTRIVIGFCT